MINWVKKLKEAESNSDKRMDLYQIEDKLGKKTNPASTSDHRAANSMMNTNSSGTDDVENIPDNLEKLQRNHASIVMVVQNKNIEKQKNTYVVKSELLKNRHVSYQYNLSQNIPFGNQCSANSSGSGFFYKISDDQNYGIIITAAHNVIGPGRRIEDFFFIHGIAKVRPGDYQNRKGISIKEHQIFEPVPGFNRYYLSELGSDFAVIMVKRKVERVIGKEQKAVKTVKAVEIREEAEILDALENKEDEHTKDEAPKSTQIYSIGHGLGLPLKFSIDGEIINLREGLPYFEATLSLLGGNSGSPIFDARTHECIGMYIRGVKKFELNKETNKLEIKKEQDSIERGDLFEGHECQKWKNIKIACEDLCDSSNRWLELYKLIMSE